MTSLVERPVEVATRTVPGHGEGTLIKGARNSSAVGTLVERMSRRGPPGPDGGDRCDECPTELYKKLRHVPALLWKPLTYDHGKEMAEHAHLAEWLNIRVVFAAPYSLGQRGTNEHTTGCVYPDQSVPKGTDWSGYTQRELNVIAHRLNTRPRTCLTFATPLEVSAQLRQHPPVALGT